MLSFEYLLTTKPHDIRAVFVSDLHLSKHTQALTQAFLKFLDDLLALPNLDKLFILGDWLDGWLGDDDATNQSWLIPILDKLRQLSCRTMIYVMHGNRDFMIGQKLCKSFGAMLIHEPYESVFYGKIYRLEHGDCLCTNDKTYRSYRKIIRNRLTKQLLSRLSLSLRQRLADTIKSKAAHDKQAKSSHIMDVNEQAVAYALRHCDVLIHGHTHRPFVHTNDIQNNSSKKRIVLGDWQENQYTVNTHIGLILHNQDGDECLLCHLSSQTS